MGALGGTISHEFGAMHSLFSYGFGRRRRLSTFERVSGDDLGMIIPLTLISDDNVLFMIGQGDGSMTTSNMRTVLRLTPRDSHNVQCSLVPLCGSVRVTTDGLRWNMS
jgi:hypothetical protein